MPLTSRYQEWDSTSAYHGLREQDARKQVQDHIGPYIKDFATESGLQVFSIADFACGQGSIASEVLSLMRRNGYTASRFGLLDVAADNLPVAIKKLAPRNSNDIIIEEYILNGSDLGDYRGRPFDLVYCWDAMVHFDLLDVMGYMKSLTRLCKGRAVFHHSNYYHATTDISRNPHWRNFNSDKVFEQICISCGHRVLDQKLISWGIPNLDCITYVEVGDLPSEPAGENLPSS